MSAVLDGRQVTPQAMGEGCFRHERDSKCISQAPEAAVGPCHATGRHARASSGPCKARSLSTRPVLPRANVAHLSLPRCANTKTSAMPAAPRQRKSPSQRCEGRLNERSVVLAPALLPFVSPVPPGSRAGAIQHAKNEGAHRPFRGLLTSFDRSDLSPPSTSSWSAGVARLAPSRCRYSVGLPHPPYRALPRRRSRCFPC